MVTSLSVNPSCLCLFSICIWGRYSISWIWNDIGRYCLLGHRNKIAKFLTRTFTCRSTFLYAYKIHLLPSYCCSFLCWTGTTRLVFIWELEEEEEGVCASEFRLDAELGVQTSLFLFFSWNFWPKCWKCLHHQVWCNIDNGTQQQYMLTHLWRTVIDL